MRKELRLVEDAVVVELKSVRELLPIHQAQILSYLRLSGKTIGLLINFNVTRLKDGIQRYANMHPPSLRPSASSVVDRSQRQ